MHVKHSDEQSTPGVRCQVCQGSNTKVRWSAYLKAYVCEDALLCAASVLMEKNLEG